MAVTEHVPTDVSVSVDPETEQYAEPAAMAYVTAPEPLPPLDDRETVEPLVTVVELGTTVNALCALLLVADVVNERVPDKEDNVFLKLSTRQ